jgi:protein-ribulosamine 3-kinase
LKVEFRGKSAWAKNFRVTAAQIDGIKKDYFVKVSSGKHGRLALQGEFEATMAIYKITPDFYAEPIASGTLHNDPNLHFYLCKFYEFSEGVPEPEAFCASLAKLHADSTSPTGKFGFHCVTYNGDLPQDNTWSDSWEVFFSKGMRHILKVREERASRNVELDSLLPTLFNKVIPRLLSPLESDGRQIKPALVHGDLWYGNAGIVDRTTGKGIIYDPASFFAHNECESSVLYA